MDRFEIRLGEEGYPESVAELPDPPSVLYGRGDPSALSTPALSIIGSRRASPYGIAVAELTGRIAAESGVTVVSGGARGCDQVAGRAALDAGGRHVVVLGTGADVVYPATSRTLIDRAIDASGCALSIEPWGTPPQKWAFPKRNRVIAALSRATLVAEAGMPSGTFSTAETANALGREVLAALDLLARVAGVELSHRQRGVLHRRRRVPRGGDLEDLRNVALLPGRCSRPFGARRRRAQGHGHARREPPASRGAGRALATRRHRVPHDVELP